MGLLVFVLCALAIIAVVSLRGLPPEFAIWVQVFSFIALPILAAGFLASIVLMGREFARWAERAFPPDEGAEGAEVNAPNAATGGAAKPDRSPRIKVRVVGDAEGEQMLAEAEAKAQARLEAQARQAEAMLAQVDADQAETGRSWREWCQAGPAGPIAS